MGIQFVTRNLICYKVFIILLNQVSCMSIFPLVSYMNMHIPIDVCCGAKRVLFTNKLSEYWCHIIKSYLFTKFHTSKHLGKSYTNMHIHIVLCCGVKRVLFTNKLSECWCRIINPLFTKFHTSKHLGKRGTQHACSHCSLLWCENGIVYQQVIKMLCVV